MSINDFAYVEFKGWIVTSVPELVVASKSPDNSDAAFLNCTSTTR